MNKTIQTVWLGKRMSPLAHACIDDWNKQGFTYKVWTETDLEIRKWIEGCRFTRECYQRGLYAFVSDYLRLKILQKYGGLYLDVDVTIRRDPFPLFEGCLFSVGYEDQNFLGTAVIYAQKESQILAELIEYYENEIWTSPLYTGPQILTQLLIDRGLCLGSTCKLYPIEYFYNYQGEPISFERSDNSHVIHWFQHSWDKAPGMSFLKSKHLGLWGRLYVWQKYFFRRFF